MHARSRALARRRAAEPGIGQGLWPWQGGPTPFSVRFFFFSAPSRPASGGPGGAEKSKRGVSVRQRRAKGPTPYPPPGPAGEGRSKRLGCRRAPAPMDLGGQSRADDPTGSVNRGKALAEARAAH